MRLIKHLSKNTILALVAFSLLTSCTFTTTKRKDPVFTVDLNTISDTIGKIIATQEVNLHGVETKKNGKVTTELTIRLINPLNAPATQEQQNEMGKHIARLLKQSMKDKRDYQVYTVLFVNQRTSGGVSESNYSGRTYKLEEL